MQKFIKNVLNTLINRKFIFIIFIAISIFLIIVIGKFIKNNSPIKIGIACTLTGTQSTLSSHIRDATILAVEEINKRGGINGRLIELIIRDDKFDPDEALRVDQELIDKGVVAIIGHSYNSLVVQVLPLINKKNILMISPVVMSPKLYRIDDSFLTLADPFFQTIKTTVLVAQDKLNIKKIAITYDLIDPELVIPISDYFIKECESLKIKITKSISFNSKQNFSAPNIAGEIIDSDAEGVYIITDAIHTALICQHLKIKNSQIKIITHGWAFTDPVFIKEGGHAVEEVIGLSFINTISPNQCFQELRDKCTKRFGKQISGLTQMAYETMQILFFALSKTTNPKKLKETILKQRVFDVVCGKIIFDKYGDPIRKIYIMEIQDGKSQLIGSIEPEELLRGDK